MKTCGNCVFADLTIIQMENENSGELDPTPHAVCRRYPPQMDHGQTLFPLVHDEDWCGEWAEDPEHRKTRTGVIE